MKGGKIIGRREEGKTAEKVRRGEKKRVRRMVKGIMVMMVLVVNGIVIVEE
ncbi:hypothetical protein Q7M_1201 (plasmid) [Borrelia crocidurae str. Achema]|uniref:Uncharacterized protein n=1 Tax=Borrelia crocidurae (strain Achema) TaxID=1155096 RepID=I0FFE3_BORCA|nr:hypothetical protein Q7M_1201 [Borrelia crocidurae str. Achema]